MTTLSAEVIDELSPEQKASMHAAKYRDTQICRSEGDAGAWFLQVEDQIHKYLIKAGVGQRGQRNDIITQIASLEGKTLRTAYSCDYAGYCEIWDDLSIAYDSYMENKQMANATRLAEQLSKEEAQRTTAEINTYWNEFVKEHHIDPTANPIKNILKCSIGTYVSANGKNAFDAAKLAIATWLFDYQGDQTPEPAPAPKTHQGIWQDDFKQHQKFFGMLTPLCSQYAIVDEKDIHRVYEHAHGVSSMNDIKTRDAEQAVEGCAVWLAANIISIADGKLRIKALFDAANVAPAVGEFKVITGYDDYAKARIGGMSHDAIEAKVEAYLHASLEDAPQSHQNADNPIIDAPVALVSQEVPIMKSTENSNCMNEAAMVVLFSMFTAAGIEMKFTIRAMSAAELSNQIDDLYATFSKRGYTAQRKQAEVPTQPITQQLAQHQAALPNQPLAQPANAGVYTSTCALIKGSMTQKGAPMCELHDDGGPHPIRVPGAIPKQLEKLKNVTKSTGQPFTADDLSNGCMNGGAWLVDWKYSDDGNYRNLVAVRPA